MRRLSLESRRPLGISLFSNLGEIPYFLGEIFGWILYSPMLFQGDSCVVLRFHGFGIFKWMLPSQQPRSKQPILFSAQLALILVAAMFAAAAETAVMLHLAMNASRTLTAAAFQHAVGASFALYAARLLRAAMRTTIAHLVSVSSIANVHDVETCSDS